MSHDHIRIEGCYRCVLPEGELQVTDMAATMRKLALESDKQQARIAELELANAQLVELVGQVAKERDDLRAEVTFLQKEVQRARARMMDCEGWRAENERLKEIDVIRSINLGRAEQEIERLETGWSLDHERHKKADERMRAMIRKHYPTIAGHVIRLQEAGEERAAAEWLAVAQDFAACQS